MSAAPLRLLGAVTMTVLGMALFKARVRDASWSPLSPPSVRAPACASGAPVSRRKDFQTVVQERLVAEATAGQWTGVQPQTLRCPRGPRVVPTRPG